MRSVKVTLEDGSSFETNINGTDEQIKEYYMGKTLNFGIEDDILKKVVGVEVYSD